MKKAGMLVFFVGFVLVAGTTAAESLGAALVAPQVSVMGGETVDLDLLFYNETNTVVERELPSSVLCKILIGGSATTVTAKLVDPQKTDRLIVAPNGFARRQVRLTLPIYASGLVQLHFALWGTLTMAVDKAPPEQWIGHQVPLDQGPSMLQSFLGDLSVYRPMYFLLGVSPGLEQSKLQFSFQYRPFNPEGFLGKREPWLSGFHLGYTQTSVWDLDDESKPFSDINYLPEVFYLWPKIDLAIDRVAAFGVQSGYLHYSNGKGGEDSRSTNFLYVEPILGFYLFGPYHLKLAPRVFTYVKNDNDTNPDLADYLGYFDLRVGVADPDGLAVDTRLWWAEKGPSVQVDLSYALTHLFGKNLNFYLQCQYVSGYAEMLLTYNQRNDAFRLGFAIVR